MSLLPDLSRYDVVGADTETTGVTWRDKPVGLSIATPDGEKRYLRWGHLGGGNNTTLREVIEWKREQIRANPGLVWAYHNAAFDVRMETYVGLPLAPRVECTNVIAALTNELEPSFSLGALGTKYLGRTKSDEALNERCASLFGGRPTRKGQAGNYHKAPGDWVDEYACDDADLTLGLYRRLRPVIDSEGLSRCYATELALIPILLKMHMTGVRVDVARANTVKRGLQEKLKQKEEEWTRLTGVAVSAVNSTKQLEAIFTRNGLPVERTEAGNPSITKELLQAIDHPLAYLVRGIRQLQHYAGTFIDNYILANVAADGCIHGEFHSVKNDRYGTVSGRMSSGGALNLQNIPARDEEWAPLIRGLFIPYSPEQEWLKIDYSQIEYRFFAHYAGGAMRQAYIDNPEIDFHQMVADLAGIPRKRAKNVNFAKLYGAGVRKMAATVGCSVEEARELVRQYDARIPEAKELSDKAARRAFTRGYIVMWHGLKRRFPPLPNGRGFMRTHIGLNALLQGSAAGLLKEAFVVMDEIIRHHSDVHLHLAVHDEGDLSRPRGERGDKITAELKGAMEDFELSVPIVAEAEVGENWGSTKKWRAVA